MSWGKAIFKEVSENIPTKAPIKTPSIASIGRFTGTRACLLVVSN